MAKVVSCETVLSFRLPLGGIARLRRVNMVAATCLALLTNVSGCSKTVGRSNINAQSNAVCQHRCVPIALSVIASHLGLSVDGVSKSDNPQRALEELGARAEAVGGRIEPIAVDRFLHDVGIGVLAPTILLDASGHAKVLLGAFERDGKLFYQILHGYAHSVLIDKTQLQKEEFREAWVAHRGSRSGGVPIRVGEGIIEVDKLWHSFGLVDYVKNQTATFRISNTGVIPVVIPKPRTSCSCVAALLGNHETINLAPSESVDMTVTVSNLPTSTIRQTVALKLFEQGTGASNETILTLLGNRPDSMRVLPTALDFGLLQRNGSPVSRVVRMNEVASDRFAVHGVDVGPLPLQYTIETSPTHDGFYEHLLRLSLTAADLDAGKHEGDIVIATDSALRPSVQIPVRFTVEPRIAPVPSTVSFGSPVAGTTVARKVVLSANENEPIDVSIVAAPASCKVTKTSHGAATELQIQGAPSEPGIWNGVVRLLVESDSWSETIEIPCVAYVRSKN